MSNELTTLSTLAVEINLLNEQVEHHKNQAVIYAARTGAKLNEVKEGLGNDKAKFVEWLDKNCTVKKTHAYNFIRLAKEMPQLLDSTVQTFGLGLNQAIELLSAPEEVREEVTAKIEAGDDVTIKEIQRLKKEAAELQASKEAIQNDLLSVKKTAENYQAMYQESSKQRDELREQNEVFRRGDQQFIDSQIEKAKAQLILENQQAIAEEKRKAENAQAELERLKKEQAKAIADGVRSELNTFDAQITHKEHVLSGIQEKIDALREVENSLEREVGYLQTHKKSIERIKDNLSFLTVSFTDAFDTACIPNEVLIDWESIHYALNKLQKQMSTFLAENRESTGAIEGELVEEFA